MSTNNGIIRYNISDSSCHIFSTVEGLQHQEFNTHAYSKDKSGYIYFAGINGVNRFHPDSIRLSNNNAPIFVRELRINDQTSHQFGHPNLLNTLQLPYSQNTIAFDFHAIDFANPSATKVKYKLQGVDHAFVEIDGTNGSARYPKLAPGNYKLILVGANADKHWNNTSREISITIHPPWWQTWWFRLSAFLAIGGILSGAIRYYYNQQLAKKDFALREQALIIEKQTALQAERTRIASEMHDDLGGGLTTIKFLSQNLLHKIGANDQKSEITRILDQSQTLVSNMSEIIWAMNAGFDTLENLVIYSRRYAREFLDTHGIDLKFEVQGMSESIGLSGEKRRNIFLVIKEALHNAVKHSNATIITISFYVTVDNLQLKVTDNGIGLNQEANENGNGLQNMKSRIESLGGDCTILSSEHKGVSVNCIIPW